MAPVGVNVVFYNVGIQNNELQSKKYPQNKHVALKQDIFRFLNADAQIIFICEFGNMQIRPTEVQGPNGPMTFENYWAWLLGDEAENMEVVSDPPYCALVDHRCWRVRESTEQCSKVSIMGTVYAS